MARASGRKRLIMIVDEDPVFRELASGWLAPTYEVAAYGDGNGLEERLKESRPDLLILDAWLRGRDAFEFCRKLARDKGWRTLPVLLVTPRHGDSFYNRSISIGGVNYLSKPTSRQEFTAMVAEILKRPADCGRPAGGGSSDQGLDLLHLLAFEKPVPSLGRPKRWMPERKSRAF